MNKLTSCTTSTYNLDLEGAQQCAGACGRLDMEGVMIITISGQIPTRDSISIAAAALIPRDYVKVHVGKGSEESLSRRTILMGNPGQLSTRTR